MRQIVRKKVHLESVMDLNTNGGKGPVTSGTSGGQERDKRGNKKRTRGKLHVQLSW